MSSYSTAFGFDFYIMPLSAAEVDIAFTGVTGAANFLPSTSGDIVAASAAVTYASGIFSVNGTAFDMDGADKAFRLYGLTNARIRSSQR
jgi:hypothetical protein